MAADTIGIIIGTQRITWPWLADEEA